MILNPQRIPHEFYATPPEGTRALLSVESFDGSIWEPACGDGAMARILSRAGYHVTATDLIDRGYGSGGVNFLMETRPRAKHIVTNPPYGTGLADSFLRHALRLTKETNGTVAFLLDVAGLAHPTRHALYVSNPPTAVYILDELICWPGGRNFLTEASQRFAWLVWKPDRHAATALHWLSTRPFRT